MEGGFILSALDSGASGPGSSPCRPAPRTLCCFLGQTTSLLRCLSPPKCIIGYQRTYAGVGGGGWG